MASGMSSPVGVELDDCGLVVGEGLVELHRLRLEGREAHCAACHARSCKEAHPEGHGDACDDPPCAGAAALLCCCCCC